MTGSTKQIAWAEDIKRDIISTVNSMVDHAHKVAGMLEQINDSIESLEGYSVAAMETVRDMIVANLDQITYAGDMINIRNNFTAANIQQLAKQVTNGQAI